MEILNCPRHDETETAKLIDNAGYSMGNFRVVCQKCGFHGYPCVTADEAAKDWNDVVVSYLTSHKINDKVA